MLKKLSRITTLMCAVITTFSLFLLVVLVSVQILTRYVAESPLIWTEEAARYTLILLTMLGAARSEERRVGKECRYRWRTKLQRKREISEQYQADATNQRYTTSL